MKNIPWKKLFLTVLIWRLVLFGFSFFADYFFTYSPSFPYSQDVLAKLNLPRWLYSWGNFDGVHYLTIASKGYFGTGLIQAFFPVFPLLIRFLGGFLVTLITQFFIIFGLVGILFYFVRKVLGKTNKTAWWSVIFLLSFPTSFFFGALYNEGIFLLLILLSFIFAKQKKWLSAGVVGALASATRVVGIAIWPALIIEWWLSKEKKLTIKNVKRELKNSWMELIQLSVSILGLMGYMLYLNKVFEDPLYFFHVQSEFGGGREEEIVLLPRVVWRYIKILATSPLDWKFFAYVQEFIFSLGTFVILLFSWKKIRFSYLAFSLLVITIPTLTGTFSSMPRYILVAFPIFYLLAEYKKCKIFALVLSLALLIINTLLFIQGYWVA